MARPNLKGIGKKQLSLLRRMNESELKILLIKDAYESTITAGLYDKTLEDLIEDLQLRFVDSLGQRNVFNISHWMPSIRIEITTLTLKKKLAIK
jgi:hypothetical protein